MAYGYGPTFRGSSGKYMPMSEYLKLLGRRGTRISHERALGLWFGPVAAKAPSHLRPDEGHGCSRPPHEHSLELPWLCGKAVSKAIRNFIT